MFDGQRIIFIEVDNKRVQLGDGGGRKCRNFGNIWLHAEGFKPFYFNEYAETYQTEFAEIMTQRIYFVVVASIKRRKSREPGKRSHGETWVAKAVILRESAQPLFNDRTTQA